MALLGEQEGAQYLGKKSWGCGRNQAILKLQERVKRKTIENWRLLHREPAALSNKADEPSLLLAQTTHSTKIPYDGHPLQEHSNGS
jgi:hypothetical protein